MNPQIAFKVKEFSISALQISVHHCHNCNHAGSSLYLRRWTVHQQVKERPAPQYAIQYLEDGKKAVMASGECWLSMVIDIPEAEVNSLTFCLPTKQLSFLLFFWTIESADGLFRGCVVYGGFESLYDKCFDEWVSQSDAEKNQMCLLSDLEMTECWIRAVTDVDK